MKATTKQQFIAPASAHARFDTLVNRWVHQMRTGLLGRVYSERTVESYLYALRLMAKANHAPLSLYCWDAKLLKRTVAYLAPTGANCHHSQRSECFNAFSSFTRWLIAMGVRPNHFRQVLALVRENRPKRYTVASRTKPALAEVTPLLNGLMAAELPRLAVATALAIYAGLRRAEIASLKASDLSPCGGHFHIVGKGQKRRVVPILPQLTPWLNLAMASWPTATYLVGFPSKSALDSECSRANKLGFSFQFHGLRRRFGTTLSQKNVPIDHIRLVLGHSSLVTTQLYIESDDEAVLQCFKGNKPIIF